MSYIMRSRLFLSLIAVYAVCCLILVLTYLPGHDTLYYLDWSRHLALGYYDGPPVVAYYMRLFTIALGYSRPALILVGLLSHVLIASLIFLLAKTLFNKEVGQYAFFIWLFTPMTFGLYALQVTYDTPACIFSLLTLYLFFMFHRKKGNIYIYAAAVAGSLMMLSKLTGAIVFISLVFLMLTKHYRYLFKNKHIYFSFVLAMVLVVPIMIWGAEVGKEGLVFQVHHGLSSWSIDHVFKTVVYIAANLGMYNVFLLIFSYCYIRHFRAIQASAELQLVFIPAMTIFLFYLLTSPALIKPGWNDLFYSTVPIAISYYMVLNRSIIYKIARASLMFYACLLLIMTFLLVPKIARLFHLDRFVINNVEKNLVLEIAPIIQHKRFVFSNKWEVDALLNYYVPRKNSVYSFLGEGNQYQFWSMEANQMLTKKTVNDFLVLKTQRSLPRIDGYGCQFLYQTQKGLGRFPVAFAKAKYAITVYQCGLKKPLS